MELTNEERLKFAAWLEAELDGIRETRKDLEKKGHWMVARSYEVADLFIEPMITRLRVHDLSSAAALLDQD